MVNIVTSNKYKSFKRKVSLVNMRCMQEKVRAMKMEGNTNESRADSRINQENKSGERI